MFNDLMSMLQDMDEDDAKGIINQLDEEQVQEGLRRMMDMYVVPHLHEVRENAREYRDTEEVRRIYESAPERKQQEIFDEAVQDLLITADMLRERPPQGFRRLKQYLRDPTTTEALLLIFENEAIEEDYRDHLKDFTAENLHHAGVFLMPEMYEEQEVRRVLDLYNIEH